MGKRRENKAGPAPALEARAFHFIASNYLILTQLSAFSRSDACVWALQMKSARIGP